MRIIKREDIENVDIDPRYYYYWIDEVLESFGKCKLPTKTRVPLEGTDYFNVMPGILPQANLAGLKVVTRNEGRRRSGMLSLDAQILLYSLDDCMPLALMDGGYITTMRTAAIAVHTMLHIAQSVNVVAMIGLGNIGTAIGDILFPLVEDRPMIVKLFRYKDHAERFAQRYSGRENLTFEIIDTYQELMENADVVLSSVTYADRDFCSPSVYKPGCTVIPVHMRGFMGCDIEFDHVITSDLTSIKKFEFYERFKKLSLLNDVIYTPDAVRESPNDRVIVYNLGIALYDLHFAGNLLSHITDAEEISL